jgi:hypothetical protein
MLGHMKKHEEKKHEEKKHEEKKHEEEKQDEHIVEDPTDLYTRGKFVQCGAGFVSLTFIFLCFWFSLLCIWWFLFLHHQSLDLNYGYLLLIIF